MKEGKIDTARLKKNISDSAETVKSLLSGTDRISAVCKAVIEGLKSGGKILTAGNGGSAAEALHLAEELTGRFRTNRRALAAVALVADSTALTCIGNDFGFEHIFSRQVEALGRKGDVLVLFSTSGKSRNIILALAAAKARKVRTICILGRDGGPLAGKGDLEIIVKSNVTERIQEAHQVLVHLVLDAVEEEFPENR